MKIFNRIRNYFENTRIDLDFPNYESQCLREHEQQSLRIFSTEQLDAERLKLLAQIESKTSKKYEKISDFSPGNTCCCVGFFL